MVSGTIPLDSYFGSTSASTSKSKGPGPRIGSSVRNCSTGNSKSSTSPAKKRKRILRTDDEEDEDEGKSRSGTASKKGKSAQISGGAGGASPLKVARNGMYYLLYLFLFFSSGSLTLALTILGDRIQTHTCAQGRQKYSNPNSWFKHCGI